MLPTSDEEEEEAVEYEVMKICDRRVVNGIVEFYVNWRGYPDTENTWEIEENCSNCQDLIREYENTHNIRTERSFYGSGREQNGFDLGWEPEKILGAAFLDAQIMLVIKFKGIDQPQFIPSATANVIIPQMVIKFYQERIEWRSLGETDLVISN